MRFLKAQTQDQPHPRLNLEPSDHKPKRSQRVYDGSGMPKDIRRVGKGMSLFKGWRDYVSKPDMAKIPDKVKEVVDQKEKDKSKCTDPEPKVNIQKCPELEQGIKVEMEHTSDPKVAEGIARDHIKELPDYYKRLKVMEKPAFWNMVKKGDLPRAKPKDRLKDYMDGKTNTPPVPQYESDAKPVDKATTAGDCSTNGSSMMHPVADGTPGEMKCKSCKIQKADEEKEESEIRQLRLKSKLSPTKRDLKELTVVKDSEKEWTLDLDSMLKSEREISGTFHKPVVDKENDIIPASAMDKAMEDFMTLPTLQEVHTERTVGIITKAWKTSEDEYMFDAVIKPGTDCDDVWKKIKSGEYDGLSIGGRRIKYSKDCSIPSAIRETPCVTHKLKLYNVSVCSSPVNPEAAIDDFNKVAKGGDDLTHP